MGALFFVCHRHGDDRRRVALFCLSGPDEALAAEADRNAGPIVAPFGIRFDAGGVGVGLSGTRGMKSKFQSVGIEGKMEKERK